MNTLLQRYQVRENPQMTERRIELSVVLLVCLLLLVSVIGATRMALDPGPGVVLPAQDTLEVRTLKLDEPVDGAAAIAILERPLFWEGRRPLAPTPVVAAQPKARATPKLSGVSLQGVYGVGDSLGLIATVDGRQQRIVSGQTVKGWRLTGYDNGVATFVSGGRETSLALELKTPSVRVAENTEPAGTETQEDPQPASREVQTSPPRPADLQKLRNVGAGLGFGGSGEKRGNQSK